MLVSVPPIKKCFSSLQVNCTTILSILACYISIIHVKTINEIVIPTAKGLGLLTWLKSHMKWSHVVRFLEYRALDVLYISTAIPAISGLLCVCVCEKQSWADIPQNLNSSFNFQLRSRQRKCQMAGYSWGSSYYGYSKYANKCCDFQNKYAYYHYGANNLVKVLICLHICVSLR